MRLGEAQKEEKKSDKEGVIRMGWVQKDQWTGVRV